MYLSTCSLGRVDQAILIELVPSLSILETINSKPQAKRKWKLTQYLLNPTPLQTSA